MSEKFWAAALILFAVLGSMAINYVAATLLPYPVNFIVGLPVAAFGGWAAGRAAARSHSYWEITRGR